MAASSSSKQVFKYDVFPSFSGEDVRRGFLSYLLREFERKAINSFIDHEIERSRPISTALLSAIREAKIAIVIFSKSYASSTWCLDELVEIHKCSKESNQMVIPIFYYVDPSDVGKQKGEFGKFFKEACKEKQEDQIQSWIQALTDVAKIAGEDLRNWPNEVDMVEKIATYVSNKLNSPSNGFGDLVGIEAHIEAMKSILCLEYEKPRMIGIWGPSGIGKSTLGRALFSHLSSQFPFCNFTTDKPMDKDVPGMKLKWEEEFLSEILGQKDLKMENSGVVKERFKDKKVLIVLDDVINPEFLKTLVGKPEWFGPGSRIIVITQDRHRLEAHKIDYLHEVTIPDEDIALTMLCRSAFGENSPPEGFKELAEKVARLAGNLPLGLNVLGSSLAGRTKKEWMDDLPRLEKGLEGNIMKILRVGYDRLDEGDQDIFLYIASLFNGKSVKQINDFFGDDKGVLKRLAEKSLIRIAVKENSDWFMNIRKNEEIVEMHDLLEKLGREIVRAESKSNPGKRRFLTDANEIQDVLTYHTGKKTLLGIFLRTSALETHISIEIDEKSLEVMRNLQFLKIDDDFDDDFDDDIGPKLRLRNGLVHLPPKLKWLEWNYCPLKCLPPNFKAECLVELRMKYSELEKLWEGTQQLGSLKTIIMSYSQNLKEIPDLSKAINLETVNFSGCQSLESGFNYLPPKLKYIHWNDYPLKCLPSNFKAEFLVELRMDWSKLEKLWEGTQQLGSLKTMVMRYSIYLKEIPDLSKAINLEWVDFSDCYILESFPSSLNSESLVYLDLKGCFKLKNFPRIRMVSLPHGIEIRVYNCLWNKNLSGIDYLDCLRRCYPIKFLPEHLVYLEMEGTTMEKLWEGVQSLGSLQKMDLSRSDNLKKVPDLSNATNLKYLNLSFCKNLVRLPSTIRNLQRLKKLEMKECTGLKFLPVDVNLSSLKFLYLNGCSSLTSFPQISTSIEELYLDHTAIEEVPCCIEMLRRLTKLSMRGCSKLENISPNIFRPANLKHVNFADCEGVLMEFGDAIVVATIEDNIQNIEDDSCVNFQNCLKLDRDARELIIQSSLKWTVILPGGEVPRYFKYRAYGNFLTVTLPQNSLSHNFLRFNVCVVVEPLAADAVFPILYDLYLYFRSNYVIYEGVVNVDMVQKWKTDHLVLCSFKIPTTGLPSTLDFNDVEFKFKFKHVGGKESSRMIKEVGIRVLNVSPSQDDRDGRSSETYYNQQSREKCDVVETESSKKRIKMTFF